MQSARQDTVTPLPLLAFTVTNIECLACITTLQGPMRIVSLASGIIGLSFLILHALGDSGLASLYGPIGNGGSERMIVYPALLWFIALGGYLMAQETTQTA